MPTCEQHAAYVLEFIETYRAHADSPTECELACQRVSVRTTCSRGAT